MGELKIVNDTDWDTKQLRKFALSGLRAEVGDYRYYVVKFHNLRENARYIGWGRYHENWMRIGIPCLKDNTSIPPEEVIRMAWTLAHEVQHNRGEKHRDMSKSSNHPVGWVKTMILQDGFTIDRKEKKAKPKVDRQAQRRAHAKKKLVEHEKKLARERKLIKKWKAKVRYYDKVFDTRREAAES